MQLIDFQPLWVKQHSSNVNIHTPAYCQQFWQKKKWKYCTWSKSRMPLVDFHLHVFQSGDQILGWTHLIKNTCTGYYLLVLDFPLLLNRNISFPGIVVRSLNFKVKFASFFSVESYVECTVCLRMFHKVCFFFIKGWTILLFRQWILHRILSYAILWIANGNENWYSHVYEYEQLPGWTALFIWSISEQIGIYNRIKLFIIKFDDLFTWT